MGFVSGLLANCPGLIHPNQSKGIRFQTRRCNRIRFYDRNAIWTVPEGIPKGRIQYSIKKHSGNGRVNSVGRDYHQLTFDNDIPEDPLWLSLAKEAVWALKSLFIFLVQQPGQLKYIEWPSFQNTKFGQFLYEKGGSNLGFSCWCSAAEDCNSHSRSCSTAHCCIIIS